ncbi:MAG: hypothetical protein AAF195_02990 [Pseudomonadota bacterium]
MVNIDYVNLIWMWNIMVISGKAAQNYALQELKGLCLGCLGLEEGATSKDISDAYYLWRDVFKYGATHVSENFTPYISALDNVFETLNTLPEIGELPIEEIVEMSKKLHRTVPPKSIKDLLFGSYQKNYRQNVNQEQSSEVRDPVQPLHIYNIVSRLQENFPGFDLKGVTDNNRLLREFTGIYKKTGLLIHSDKVDLGTIEKLSDKFPDINITKDSIKELFQCLSNIKDALGDLPDNQGQALKDFAKQIKVWRNLNGYEILELLQDAKQGSKKEGKAEVTTEEGVVESKEEVKAKEAPKLIKAEVTTEEGVVESKEVPPEETVTPQPRNDAITIGDYIRDRISDMLDHVYKQEVTRDNEQRRYKHTASALDSLDEGIQSISGILNKCLSCFPNSEKQGVEVETTLSKTALSNTADWLRRKNDKSSMMGRD